MQCRAPRPAGLHRLQGTPIGWPSGSCRRTATTRHPMGAERCRCAGKAPPRGPDRQIRSAAARRNAEVGDRIIASMGTRRVCKGRRTEGRPAIPSATRFARARDLGGDRPLRGPLLIERLRKTAFSIFISATRYFSSECSRCPDRSATSYRPDSIGRCRCT
jgi:hypothetical protein